jgi:hypothetical protein
MRLVRGVLRAGYGLVVGDDWKIFAAVVTGLGGGLLLLVGGVGVAVVAAVTGLLIGGLFVVAMIVDVLASGT